MTYQIRPLFHQIQQALKEAGIPYDPLLPTQIKTVTAINRLEPDRAALIGMAILPGRINVLLRPKTFVVETTRIDHQAFITTYSVVVMDAAGDLRLVEDITANDGDPDGTDRFVDQVANLLDEQAKLNAPPSHSNLQTINVLHEAARQIARHPKPQRAGWVTYILELLEEHTDPVAYGEMLTELGLAIEVQQLEGTW